MSVSSYKNNEVLYQNISHKMNEFLSRGVPSTCLFDRIIQIRKLKNEEWNVTTGLISLLATVIESMKQTLFLHTLPDIIILEYKEKTPAAGKLSVTHKALRTKVFIYTSRQPGVI